MPVLNMQSQLEILQQLELEDALEEYMDDNLYVQTEELRKTLKSKGVKDREIEEMLLQQKRKYIYSLYDYMKFMKRKEDFNANKAATAR